MFWLISLLMPGRFRQQRDAREFLDFAGVFSSPRTRGLLFQILGIVAAIALSWVIFVAVLTLLNVWLMLLMTVILGTIVFVRESRSRQRERWINGGFCSACGYDLRASPQRCPECGRDAKIDEPIWRRMRRELEEKLLADASNPSSQVEADLSEISEVPQPIVDPLAPPAHLLRNKPVVDDGPIPLE